MNMEEAKEYAREMSYCDAVYNALKGRAIPYRQATKIKLEELLKIAQQIDELKENDNEDNIRSI